MSKRGLILVEGQTEEQFVKNVVAPAFEHVGFFIKATILTTKRVKDGPDFKGGVANFGKFEYDLRQLIRGAGGGALVTTMLDYFRLPSDFPGMADRPAAPDPRARVEHVEQALAKHFEYRHFIPFLSLHEFEAWLFSCPKTLPRIMTESAKSTEFASILASANSPEEINERPGSNPAARISSVFPGYRKALHGPAALKQIGLDKVRASCPHFDDWIAKLEQFAGG